MRNSYRNQKSDNSNWIALIGYKIRRHFESTINIGIMFWVIQAGSYHTDSEKKNLELKLVKIDQSSLAWFSFPVIKEFHLFVNTKLDVRVLIRPKYIDP